MTGISDLVGHFEDINYIIEATDKVTASVSGEFAAAGAALVFTLISIECIRISTNIVRGEKVEIDKFFLIYLAVGIFYIAWPYFSEFLIGETVVMAENIFTNLNPSESFWKTYNDMLDEILFSDRISIYSGWKKVDHFVGASIIYFIMKFFSAIIRILTDIYWVVTYFGMRISALFGGLFIPLFLMKETRGMAKTWFNNFVWYFFRIFILQVIFATMNMASSFFYTKMAESWTKSGFTMNHIYLTLLYPIVFIGLIVTLETFIQRIKS